MLHITQPIIFLDVDGVLNSMDFMHYTHALGKDTARVRLDPLCVDKLQQLVDKTNAVVVISSTWRKHLHDMWDLMSFFSTYAIPVIGVTPGSKDGIRHKEIRQWLRDHYVTHDCYIALDDDSYDMVDLKDHFIHTDRKIGLTAKDVSKAIKVIEDYRASLEKDAQTSDIERLTKLKETPCIHG